MLAGKITCALAMSKAFPQKVSIWLSYSRAQNRVLQGLGGPGPHAH